MVVKMVVVVIEEMSKVVEKVVDPEVAVAVAAEDLCLTTKIKIIIKKSKLYPILSKTLSEAFICDNSTTQLSTYSTSNLSSDTVDTQKLLVYYQNVKSILSVSKFQNFCTSVSLCTVIIVLTETWLENDQYVAYYVIDGYTTYRTDRFGHTSGKQSGEGCLIAVSNQLISSPIILRNRGVEQFFVKLQNL